MSAIPTDRAHLLATVAEFARAMHVKREPAIESRTVAKCFRAFEDLDDEGRSVVRKMTRRIQADCGFPDEERVYAADVIVAALFPQAG